MINILAPIALFLFLMFIVWPFAAHAKRREETAARQRDEAAGKTWLPVGTHKEDTQIWCAAFNKWAAMKPDNKIKYLKYIIPPPAPYIVLRNLNPFGSQKPRYEITNATQRRRLLNYCDIILMAE